MKKNYRIARAVLVVLTALVFLIVTINEDGTTIFFCTVVFAAAALFLSFPAEKISRRMIAVGDGIRKGWKRVLYYIGLLILLLVLSAVAYFVISGEWFGTTPGTLGDALMIVFFYTLAVVAILLPYILTLLVLLLRKGCANGNTTQTAQEK